MAQRAKIVARIRNNPRDVSFDDARKVAGWLGFIGSGGKGSHVALSRPGEATGLTFQNRGGKIPTYQAKQLIVMIDRYWGEGDA